MTNIYKKRWGSEELHRSLKQNTALEKMPAKMESSQANHILASMIAQVKLEALRMATKEGTSSYTEPSFNFIRLIIRLLCFLIIRLSCQ